MAGMIKKCKQNSNGTINVNDKHRNNDALLRLSSSVEVRCAPITRQPRQHSRLPNGHENNSPSLVENRWTSVPFTLTMTSPASTWNINQEVPRALENIFGRFNQHLLIIFSLKIFKFINPVGPE